MPTRTANNRTCPTVATPSSNRAAAPWSTSCPFCRTAIGLARGVPTTTICPTCGLRFTVDKAVRSSGSALPQRAPNRRESRWARVLTNHPIAVGVVSLMTAVSLLATVAIWARGF